MDIVKKRPTYPEMKEVRIGLEQKIAVHEKKMKLISKTLEEIDKEFKSIDNEFKEMRLDFGLKMDK